MKRWEGKIGNLFRRRQSLRVIHQFAQVSRADYRLECAGCPRPARKDGA
jgi:hypothetical protein